MLATLHSVPPRSMDASARTHTRTKIFWPWMTEDIERIRDSCRDCVKNASSQEPLPAVISNPPCDTIWDDSRWLLWLTSVNTTWSLGIDYPDRVTSSKHQMTPRKQDQKTLLKQWGITHRLSSAYNPQSNGEPKLQSNFKTSALIKHRIIGKPELGPFSESNDAASQYWQWLRIITSADRISKTSQGRLCFCWSLG